MVTRMPKGSWARSGNPHIQTHVVPADVGLDRVRHGGLAQCAGDLDAVVALHLGVGRVAGVAAAEATLPLQERKKRFWSKVTKSGRNKMSKIARNDLGTSLFFLTFS